MNTALQFIIVNYFKIYLRKALKVTKAYRENIVSVKLNNNSIFIICYKHRVVCFALMTLAIKSNTHFGFYKQ